MKEYERLERIGTEPHRAYYIPFAEDDRVGTKFGIVNRATSSRFISLDGTWLIKQHRNVEEAVLSEELTEKIPVPACVQMHGYDHIQYINSSFTFPVMLPLIPYDNPCWHYLRSFAMAKGKADMGSYVIEDESDAQKNEKSAEQRLTELQNLYDRRLISTEEYEQKRKEILEEL